MPSEYEARRIPGQEDTTLPALPRPLKRPQHVIRAANLTGDPSGNSPSDDHATWQGINLYRFKDLEYQEEARQAELANNDALWG